MVFSLTQPSTGQMGTIPIGSQQQDLLKMWYETVLRYSRMNLTKASDTLPAIVGLEGLMKKYLNIQYFYGHWESGIVQSLLWTGRSARSGNDQPPIAPYGRGHQSKKPSSTFIIHGRTQIPLSQTS